MNLIASVISNENTSTNKKRILLASSLFMRYIGKHMNTSISNSITVHNAVTSPINA